MRVFDYEAMSKAERQLAKSIGSHEELDESDVLIVHSAVSACACSHIDSPCVVILHGGCRSASHFYPEVVESSSEAVGYFSERAIQDVRGKISGWLSSADVVVSNSEYVKQAVKRNYGIDSRVIYPPINEEVFHNTDNDGDFYLSVQRMEWYKKLDSQIEAFKSLDEELVIVGEGDLSNPVKRETERYDNIKYLGKISDEKLVRLYSAANATIQTSIKEDFGYVPREGLSCGTPAITVNEGGYKELHDKGDVGVLFSPENRADSLRAAVEGFDQNNYDPITLREIAQANYGLSVVGKQYNKAIKDAISRFNNDN